MKNLNRRKFLKKTSLSSAILATGSLLGNCSNDNKSERKSTSIYMGDFAAPKLKKVRVAFIGVGARGTGHAKQIATIDGTEIVAISDLYKDLVERSKTNSIEIGKGERHKNIQGYYGSDEQWKLMLKEVRPDIVFISTNWNNHAPMVIEAMKKDVHAFVEVPIATNIEDMWKIIDTSEKTQKHCMMMENVNYGRDELMFLNMCREGIILVEGLCNENEPGYAEGSNQDPNGDDYSYETNPYGTERNNKFDIGEGTENNSIPDPGEPRIDEQDLDEAIPVTTHYMVINTTDINDLDTVVHWSSGIEGDLGQFNGMVLDIENNWSVNQDRDKSGFSPDMDVNYSFNFSPFSD